MSKQFVFKLLLVVFSFILIPSTYWHDCEENHSVASHNGSSIEKQHAFCSICDFDLFQLDTPHSSQFYYSKKIHPVEEFILLSNSNTHFKLNFNKGPPKC